MGTARRRAVEPSRFGRQPPSDQVSERSLERPFRIDGEFTDEEMIGIVPVSPAPWRQAVLLEQGEVIRILCAFAGGHRDHAEHALCAGTLR
jgi:hypothetical protein